MLQILLYLFTFILSVSGMTLPTSSSGISLSSFNSTLNSTSDTVVEIAAANQLCDGAVRLFGRTKYRGDCYTWGSGWDIASRSADNADCISFPANFIESFRVVTDRRFKWECVFFADGGCGGYRDSAVSDRPDFGQDKHDFQTFKCYLQGGASNPYGR